MKYIQASKWRTVPYGVLVDLPTHCGIRTYTRTMSYACICVHVRWCICGVRIIGEDSFIPRPTRKTDLKRGVTYSSMWLVMFTAAIEITRNHYQANSVFELGGGALGGGAG